MEYFICIYHGLLYWGGQIASRSNRDKRSISFSSQLPSFGVFFIRSYNNQRKDKLYTRLTFTNPSRQDFAITEMDTK